VIDQQGVVAQSTEAPRVVLEPARADRANRAAPAATLTQREAELLGWVEQGMSNADIAVLCGISVRTVHKHLEHVFRKLNVENRAAAVRKWRDLTA
jgi:DNA-binding CsgD family transcriptional regulator